MRHLWGDGWLAQRCRPRWKGVVSQGIRQQQEVSCVRKELESEGWGMRDERDVG